MIQDLVEENKEVIDKISKLKKELDILQNKMADYDELQRGRSKCWKVAQIIWNESHRWEC